MLESRSVSAAPGASRGLTGSALAALFILFFVSGAVALNYEVLWQRQFALVLGGAAPATAAVLAAYFTGLGLGNLLLGKFAAKWARPLRIYALLEAGVAVGALLVTPILGGLERLHPRLFEQFSAQPALFSFVKALLAFFPLALPTFCMGGTLPVLGRLADAGQRKLGCNAGLLYVANTAGAAVGALAVPFYLLPKFGVNGSTWFCAAANLILALGAWQMDSRLIRDINLDHSISRTDGASRLPRTNPVLMVLMLAWVSGLATFILQVLWNRAFAQVHENSVYSFAVLVSVFILALALGAQLARVGLKSKLAPLQLTGIAWTVAGITTVFGPLLFFRLTGGLQYFSTEGAWSHQAFRFVGAALAVFALPVTLLGVGLPAIMEQAGRASRRDPSVLLGQVLAANIIGSVIGALLAGFVLPPWIGLWRSIILIAALLMVVGGWMLASFLPRVQRYLRWSLVIGFCASLWLISKIEWPRVRVTQTEGEPLIAISEGTYGITAVTERGNSRRLKLNNYYVLGGTASSGDERMQAHLPLLIHPAPRRVAFLGLGTGITAGGALFHPVDRITAVELVPEVVDAARTHFASANQHVLEDRRTTIVVEDARSYLRGTREKFDVIIGDLVVPWRQGEGALFTLEHFAAGRETLAAGGLFCQWLPLFQLSERELQIIIRTFLSVFPRVSIWRGEFSPNQPSIALIASAEPIELKLSDIDRRIRELNPDPLNPHLGDPAAFWMHFLGLLQMHDLDPEETRINREDRPWVELLGPMEHGGQRKEILCVSRRFQNWVVDLKRRSQNSIPQLNAAAKAGYEAGDLMFDFTLLMSEGKQRSADEVQARLRSVLPEQTFKKIFQ